ncbi:MAG TPA: hypothetical protein PKM12_01405 [Marmoricola sp.]|nr:hypothetical protein [Marmoricola sp.]HNI70195.1 hypothetical protein [Marmoricola sp.]HNN47589.1 hypothetical protein [Marmoricola sp.]HNO39031.1 hypothetical protein [Marmoricola sp.]
MRLLALLGAVILTVVLLPGGADARPMDDHGKTRAVITFAKNWAAPDASTITWRFDRRQGGQWVTMEEQSWRAGSGMLGKRGRNECTKNVGWLPNGEYGVRLRTPYRGRLIKGNVLQIDNKPCDRGRGVLRQMLFVHTEQGDGGRQCRNRRGDDVCRWEFPKFNDYRSYGCIKMAPGDLAALVRRYREHLRPEVRYPLDQVVLKVVNGQGRSAKRVAR